MTTVLTHGVFDLLHVGHVEHLRQAKKWGDTLIVSVVADEFITKRQPIYSQEERITLLRSLAMVDKVILCKAPGPEKIIQDIHPNIYVRGSDYAGEVLPEFALLMTLHIPLGYTWSCPPHTTDILQRIKERHV